MYVYEPSLEAQTGNNIQFYNSIVSFNMFICTGLEYIRKKTILNIYTLRI